MQGRASDVRAAAHPPAAPQAKRVLWGGAEPAGEAPPVRMDYRQMRKYVAR